MNKKQISLMLKDGSFDKGFWAWELSSGLIILDMETKSDVEKRHGCKVVSNSADYIYGRKTQ